MIVCNLKNCPECSKPKEYSDVDSYIDAEFNDYVDMSTFWEINPKMVSQWRRQKTYTFRVVKNTHTKINYKEVSRDRV